MKNIKLTLISFALITLGFNGYSQTEEDNSSTKKISKHALGLAAGVSTGYGLSYQYTPSKLTFQLAFSPLKNDYRTLISSGLTFIYRIKEGEKANFFLYQANHYIIERRNNGFFGPSSNRDRFNNGIGLGFEIFVGKNVLLNFMGGYGARDNFKQLGITGEIGLFYKL